MIKPIAYSYWRSLQRGTRAFYTIPAELRDDVRTLAREDVEKGTLTKERYEDLIGVAY